MHRGGIRHASLRVGASLSKVATLVLKFLNASLNGLKICRAPPRFIVRDRGGFLRLDQDAGQLGVRGSLVRQLRLEISVSFSAAS